MKINFDTDELRQRWAIMHERKDLDMFFASLMTVIESERQRADDSERANRQQYRDLVAGQEVQKQLESQIERITAQRLQENSMNLKVKLHLNERATNAEAELSELKGDQVSVEVADSIAMQNVKDIAHCLSDIRRFVEAKFMTVGDLPSPEGLLLSGPEWKHESDAIIAALNRVANFYESQHVLKEIGYEEAYALSPNNDRPDITHGFKFGWNAYHKAAIEAAGGVVKDGE